MKNIIKDYWDEFYVKKQSPSNPSPFSEYCFNNYIKNTSDYSSKHLLDLGCGNGRDSNYFAENKLKVTAVDLSSEVINNNKFSPINPNFISNNAVDSIINATDIDYVYMRWFLHAIKEIDERHILKNSYDKLNKNGLIFIEVRSIHDHLFGKGVKISENEFIDTHYRRFHQKDKLVSFIKNIGFDVIHNIENDGYSKYRDDNPVLIRIVAKK